MRPLEGIRVAMLLGTNNLVRDNRVRKEARSLSEAGASVTVYCYTNETEVTDEGLSSEPFKTIYVGDITYGEIEPKPQHPTYFEISNERWPRFLRIAEHLFFNAVYNNPRIRRYVKKHEQWDEAYEKWLVRYTQYRPYFMHMDLIEKPDIVHAHDLDTLYAAAHIARREDAKLIYDSHEIYLQQDWGDDVKDWIAVLAEIERVHIHEAAALITVMPDISQMLVDQYRYIGPTLEIYNGSDRILPRSSSVHAPVKFLFSGMFDPERNLPELVMAMKDLRGVATLTFQGYGGIQNELEELVQKEGLQDTVLFVDPVLPGDIVDSYLEYDIGTLIWKPTTKNMQISAPNKLFDYMSAGLALVGAEDLTFISSVIEENDAGFLFRFDSTHSISEAFQKICENREEIAMKKEASLEAARKYCWDEQAKRLVQLYCQLTNRPVAS